MCRLSSVAAHLLPPSQPLPIKHYQRWKNPMIFAPHEARPNRGREFTLRIERLMPEVFIRMRLSKSNGLPLCRGSLAHATSPSIDTTEL